MSVPGELEGASERRGAHRLLAPFAVVRPGEAAFSILLALGIFLLLTCYYVLKTVREPLILTSGVWRLSGQELKTYAAAAQSVFFLLAVPLYGRLARRADHRRLLGLVVLFFVLSLLALYVLGQAGVPIGIAFYVWLGILGVMLVAQFWSLANDLCTQEQGMRLFALIAVGGSLGSIAGAALARWLAGPLGVLHLILVGAVLLAADIAVLDAATRLAPPRPPAPDAPERPGDPGDPPPKALGGFRLVLRSRYLLLISGMLLLGNLVNTQGEFILADVVKEHAQAQAPDDGHAELDGKARHDAVKAERQRIIARFYGEFYAAVNLAAFLLQAFVVSRIIKVLDMRLALVLLPMVALGGYGLVAWSPTLLLVGMVKLGENSADYSLHNTLKQALFLPTRLDEKYKAKLATDTFFVRLGDMMAALAVYAGLHLLGLTRAGFAFVNVGLAAVWIVAALAIGAHHRRLSI